MGPTIRRQIWSSSQDMDFITYNNIRRLENSSQGLNYFCNSLKLLQTLHFCLSILHLFILSLADVIEILWKEKTNDYYPQQWWRATAKTHKQTPVQKCVLRILTQVFIFLRKCSYCCPHRLKVSFKCFLSSLRIYLLDFYFLGTNKNTYKRRHMLYIHTHTQLYETATTDSDKNCENLPCF